MRTFTVTLALLSLLLRPTLNLTVVPTRRSFLLSSSASLLLSPQNSSPSLSADPLLAFFNDVQAYTVAKQNTPVMVVSDSAEIESIYFPSFRMASSLLQSIKKSESSKPKADRIYGDAGLSSKPLSTVYLLSLRGKVSGQRYLVQNSDSNIESAKSLSKLESLKRYSVPLFYVEKMEIEGMEYLFFEYEEAVKQSKKLGYKVEDIKVTELYEVVEEIIKDKNKDDPDIPKLRLWREPASSAENKVERVKDGERIIVL
ncbi:hypothetical protein TrST_g10945 [Triparma strigata]|uniref:Uncharacterized protein n=1 Tax=Triparma strigata TaxID=1606541 RepID=A0A9W7BY29_9STRA|nr:hypothetical protein TrST_g10945 [Triparma strigata]